MTKPLLYISYGMTKCASTLAFELVRTALEHAGHTQHPLEALPLRRKINFIEHLSQAECDALRAEIESYGYPFVLKTHTRIDPPLKALFEEGFAIGHAAFRDPRDMALSMLDHGRKAREEGSLAFSEYHRVKDTLPEIRYQIDTLEKWLQLPNIYALRYDDIAFNTAQCCALLLKQLSLEGDPETIANFVLKKRFIQFNKGIPNRFLTEMNPIMAQKFRSEFAPLYELLQSNDPLSYKNSKLDITHLRNSYEENVPVANQS